MLTKARAFAPSGISSFFEICDTTNNGKQIPNLERVGARGGGFVTEGGVLTEVNLTAANATTIEISINGINAPEAKTTRTVAEKLLCRISERFKVRIEHRVKVPIGAGFGSSAGGALSTALALSKALKLSCTYNELGRIAHVAEIRCKTGLGTVGPLMVGGCILTVEPGAPGQAVIDRIPLSPDIVIVAGAYGSISTRSILESREKRAIINKNGRKTLERIISDPSLENFLTCCHDFAEETGFMTDRLRNLAKLADKAGAIGAAQNMVGDVIHAVTTQGNVRNVFQAFEKVLPRHKIIVTKVENEGAKLVK